MLDRQERRECYFLSLSCSLQRNYQRKRYTMRLRLSFVLLLGIAVALGCSERNFGKMYGQGVPI